MLLSDESGKGGNLYRTPFAAVVVYFIEED